MEPVLEDRRRDGLLAGQMVPLAFLRPAVQAHVALDVCLRSRVKPACQWAPGQPSRWVRAGKASRATWGLKRVCAQEERVTFH